MKYERCLNNVLSPSMWMVYVMCNVILMDIFKPSRCVLLGGVAAARLLSSVTSGVEDILDTSTTPCQSHDAGTANDFFTLPKAHSSPCWHTPTIMFCARKFPNLVHLTPSVFLQQRLWV